MNFPVRTNSIFFFLQFDPATPLINEHREHSQNRQVTNTQDAHSDKVNVGERSHLWTFVLKGWDVLRQVIKHESKKSQDRNIGSHTNT